MACGKNLISKKVSCVELVKNRHKVSRIWSSLQSLCFHRWCAYQNCELRLSQNCCYSRFRVFFPPRSCYRSFYGFWKAYLHHDLKCVGGTPKPAETANIETLGRAYKQMCSAALRSSWLLSCQLTGCGLPRFWSRGKHGQSKGHPCLPLHLQLANSCY